MAKNLVAVFNSKIKTGLTYAIIIQAITAGSAVFDALAICGGVCGGVAFSWC